MLCNDEVVLVSSGETHNELISDLIKVKSEREDLVLCDTDNILEVYNIGISFRRSSQTKAREDRVKDSLIDLLNRWQKGGGHKGGKLGGTIRDYYTEICLIRKRLISHSLPL